MNTEQLLDDCLDGNPAAQKKLYEQLAGKMMGVCLRYARNEDEAKDVLQDGFVKVFQKLSSFKREGSFEGWVRRIMVNTALDYLRKNKTNHQMIDADSVDYLLESDDFIFESLAAEDLLKILQKIPDGYRTVFNMFAIEGYSHKEIADELDISVNTSKSQYSRARNHLKKIIEEYQIRY